MSADFTPTLKPYNKLNNFWIWCQKVLPLVYDDSLSYYELLCKLMKYLNEMINNQNNMYQDISDLHDAFEQLQEYVNNYFSDLNIQEEVNNIIEQLLNDGKLNELLNLFIPYVTPEMFGAVGDGITDDSNSFNEAIKNGNVVLWIPNKTYKINNQIEIKDNTRIICDGRIIYDVSFKLENNYDGFFFGNNVTNVVIDGLSITGNGATAGNYDPGVEILFKTSKNVIVRNSRIENTNRIACIAMMNNCEDCNIENNVINKYNYIGIGLICESAEIDANKRIIITGNDVSGCTNRILNGYAISMSLATTNDNFNPSENCVCDSNICHTDYAWWEAIDAHGGYDLIISNNTISGFLVGIAAIDGDNFMQRRCTITGNTINCGTNGVTTSTNYAITCGGRNITIGNNTIANGGILNGSIGGGIYCRAGSSNITVIGNMFYNCKWNTLYSAASSLIFSNNNIINSAQYREDTTLYYADAGSNNVLIENNNIRNCGHIFGRAGSVRYSANPPIYFKNNYIEKDFYIPVSNWNGALPDRIGDIANISAGQIGDIIYNSEPQNGKPIGWICTQTATDESPATWNAMANLT